MPFSRGQMQADNFAMENRFAAHPAGIVQLKPICLTCKPERSVSKDRIAANAPSICCTSDASNLLMQCECHAATLP